MEKGLEQKTIREIVRLVEDSSWILPTFQRRFVWSQEQICDLFDSIMRGYPINTFMVWRVNNQTARSNKFYRFIQDYQEFWREIGESFSDPANELYYAVIDGQQRINSLYIGYHGSYATKLPRKHWKAAYDESIQPKTHLYLNLFEDADDTSSRIFDFRFLSSDMMRTQENRSKWFRVGNILSFTEILYDEIDDRLPDMIDERHLLDNCSESERKSALKKLKMLYRKTFYAPIINYHQEEIQELDRVVNVFLRTNGGGTPLEFSDLVMSVTVRQWAESKDKIEDLIKLVYSETGIVLNKDFVLKVFLMLYSSDISFKVKNFEDEDLDLVNKAKIDFDRIHKTILAACKYANQIGLNNENLRSKYALIPIIYYSFKRKKFDVDNTSKETKNRSYIEIWIKSALLKGMFGGKPDAVLTAIKQIIDNKLSGNSKSMFPVFDIIKKYKNKPKDISIDESFILDKIETSQWGSVDAFLLLSLAQQLDPQQRYHVDHMYPKDMFKNSKLDRMNMFANGQNPELRNFYVNKDNWNTVGNLQLLNDTDNLSKSNKSLFQWISEREKGYDLDRYFIPKEDGDYIVQDDKFKEFITKRKKLLVKAIMKRISLED